MHQELRRDGVTLGLLWQEYKAVHPSGYQYSQFCNRYRVWSGTLDLPMRQTHKAGREGYSVLYHRLPRLFQELAVARGDGRYPKVLRALARVELLALDDWGTVSLADEQRRDLFEVLEDRYDRRSTLVASQLPLKHWHETLGDPTLADAILDRLVHNAHKLELKRDSMRKKRTPLNPKANPGT